MFFNSLHLLPLYPACPPRYLLIPGHAPLCLSSCTGFGDNVAASWAPAPGQAVSLEASACLGGGGDGCAPEAVYNFSTVFADTFQVGRSVGRFVRRARAQGDSGPYICRPREPSDATMIHREQAVGAKCCRGKYGRTVLFFSRFNHSLFGHCNFPRTARIMFPYIFPSLFLFHYRPTLLAAHGAFLAPSVRARKYGLYRESSTTLSFDGGAAPASVSVFPASGSPGRPADAGSEGRWFVHVDMPLTVRARRLRECPHKAWSCSLWHCPLFFF